MKEKFLFIFTISALILMLCGVVPNSPYDENSPDFVRPVIKIDTLESSLKPNDTIHFDSASLLLVGNMIQSRFQVKLDNLPWSSWKPSGIVPFSSLSDGRHVVYINTMYEGGVKTFQDSIVFFVQVQGYRPLFPPMEDTVISVDTGNAISLSVSAEGAAPLMYQWYKDLVILTGKMSTDFTLFSFTLKDTGAYFCIVYNNYGSDTSRIFSVNVYQHLIDTGNATLKVVYDGNGSSSGSAPVDQKTYKQGMKVTVLGNIGNLVKNGFVFGGWNTKADGNGKTYAAGDTFSMGASNDTLFAKWKLQPTLTITYDSNGKTGGSVPVDTNKYGVGDSVVVLGNLGNLTKIGYFFGGWNTKSDGSGITYNAGSKFPMPSVSDTLFAKWTTNPTWAVVYLKNGAESGSVPQEANYEAGAIVTVSDNTGNLKKTGYVFSDWNTKADGTGTTYAAGATFTKAAVNDTLYAFWKSYSYTIIFDGQGATTQPNPATKTVTSPNTTVDALPVIPEKIGYIFGGWFTGINGGGTEFTVTTTVTANDTVYAKWNAGKYTITFNDQGATTHVSPTSKSVTPPATNIGSLPTEPKKTGYIFGGWYTEPNGAGLEFTATSTVTTNDTVYAKWNSYSYSIFFDGQGATTPPNPTSRLINSPATTLPADSLPTPPQKTGGYEFGGWYMDAACTGAKLTTTTQFTSNDTVYTKWTKTYTLTITNSPAAGGSVTKNPNTTVYASGTSVTITANTNSGYRFNNWTGDYTGSSSSAQITMNKDYAITANFLRRYTVNFSATPAGRGLITKPTTSSVTIDSGVALDITATPANGFKFKQWTSSNAGVSFVSSTSASTKLNVTQDVSTVNVQAVFGCITFRRNLYEWYNPTSVVQHDDGSYGVAYEYSYTSGILKLNANGDSLWDKKACDIGEESSHNFPIGKINNGFLVGASGNDTTLCRVIGISSDANSAPIFTWNPCADFDINFCIYRAYKTNDGGYILAGYDNEWSRSMLIKANSSRQKSWTMNISDLERIADAQQTQDGGCVMVGGSTIVKVNNAGTTINFSTPFSNLDAVFVRQISATDGYIVGGATNSLVAGLVKISATGAVVSGWPKLYSNTDGYVVSGCVASDGGFVFITNGGSFVKTNSNGDIIWNKKFPDSGNYYINLTNDSGFIIAYRFNWILKTDENGDTD